MSFMYVLTNNFYHTQALHKEDEKNKKQKELAITRDISYVHLIMIHAQIDNTQTIKRRMKNIRDERYLQEREAYKHELLSIAKPLRSNLFKETKYC